MRSDNRLCYMKTRIFPVLWFIQERLRRQELKKKAEMLRGQGHLMEVHQRIGLRYKTSLNLRSGFEIKSLQNSQDLVVIRSSPKLKRGIGSNSPNEKPTCENSHKNHYGYCLKRTDNCLVVERIGTR